MLRALTLLAFISATPALSQDLPSASTHGGLVDRKLEEAEALGDDLKTRLKLMEMEFDLPEGLAERAINSIENGRVRELLNISPDDLPQLSEEEENRYPQGVFLFASFSIPDLSLQAILRDATALGIPVVFNGFVGNSVLETEARVRELYEDSDLSHGFTIDPTLFTRFRIQAVPTLISTSINLDVCETTGCGGDGLPAHDRVAGNAPLRTLLGIIATGNTEHARPVQAILERAQ